MYTELGTQPDASANSQEENTCVSKINRWSGNGKIFAPFPTCRIDFGNRREVANATKVPSLSQKIALLLTYHLLPNPATEPILTKYSCHNKVCVHKIHMLIWRAIIEKSLICPLHSAQVNQSVHSPSTDVRRAGLVPIARRASDSTPPTICGCGATLSWATVRSGNYVDANTNRH